MADRTKEVLLLFPIIITFFRLSIGPNISYITKNSHVAICWERADPMALFLSHLCCVSSLLFSTVCDTIR